MLNKIILSLVISIGMVSCIDQTCPPVQLTSGCFCANNKLFGIMIQCSGLTVVDLPGMFTMLSTKLAPEQRHFPHLTLQSLPLNELPENLFKDITFDSIEIKFNANLTKVHANAFAKTDQVTKNIRIRENSKLDESLDNSLFEALKKFTNIESIDLGYNNLTKIPDNAFGVQTRLREINLSFNPIKSIGANVFAQLDSLAYLGLANTSLSHIPDHMLALNKPSDNDLYVSLYDNILLTSNGFSADSFTATQRPTHLDFGWQYPNIITYLDEKVFQPFLAANQHNQISLFGQNIDCNDCRNSWLTKSPQLLERLNYLKCMNGKDFKDPTNFAKC